MKITSIVTVGLVIFIFGCKSTTPTSVQKTSGLLSGTVALIDINGNSFADKSGVLIQPEGYSQSALSDSNGNWSINGLSSHTYNLVFSKTGYGTMKHSITYIGEDTIRYPTTVYLFQELTCNVILDSVSVVFDSIFSFTKKEGYESGRVTNISLTDSTNLKVIVYFGYSPNIILGDTTTYIGGSLFQNPSPAGYPLTKQGSDLKFRYDNWEICGPNGWMQHGKTVYVQAFVIRKSGEPVITDVATGKWQYVNKIPKSNVVSVVIP